nr:immunoglobulin heavy chain junction region [Mus musculus]NSM07435.1 immunoglobulin heavy chain junction region [Mus musculus]
CGRRETVVSFDYW